jgi:hypothetical protein
LRIREVNIAELFTGEEFNTLLPRFRTEIPEV